MKFVCKVCGYIHEGDAPLEQCPKCKQFDVFMQGKENKSNPYAGTQTEKNLMTAFEVNQKQETNIHILHRKQKKTDMNKLQHYF